MTEKQLDELLSHLEFQSDELGTQQVIDLNNLDLCAPDNIRSMDMPYPDRPDNMDDILKIINGDDIKALVDGATVINANPLVADYIKQKILIPSIARIVPNIKDIPNINDIIVDLDELKNNILSSFDSTDTYDYPTDNYAIIEFGDDYTLGDKVEYELTIEPGTNLTDKTIIGTIMQGGKKKEIRSIFNKGKVLKNPDGSFYHLYPDTCNRHIVIKDFEYGQGFDFDTSEIETYQNKFISNTMLYNLIKDNIVYSGLPDILLNREPKILHFIKFHICPFKHSHNIYNDYIEDFEDELDEKQTLITKACSVERLKATKGNTERVNEVADDVNAKREEILSWIISVWRKAKSQPMCKYIDSEDDCRYLAQSSDSKGSVSISRDKFDVIHIGETKVSNYYGQLLGRIQMIYGDYWSKKYFDVLSDIIIRRMNAEQYSITYLISEFNILFNKTVSSLYPNPYAEILKNFGNKKDLTYGDIYGWVKENQGKVNNYRLELGATQLANICWFIMNYEGKTNNSMEMQSGPGDDILDLVKEEQAKLHNFWDEAINAYYGISVTKLINEFKEYANNINPYAEWPPYVSIPVLGITYKLYTFANPQLTPTPLPEIDEDVDLDDISEPPEPTDFPIPKEPSDDNDSTLDEITIKDYDYWKRYFALATVISIPFLADGFDIPPTMTPIPLPCIWICFSTIFIKQLNLVIVIGLAIRGIWPWPVVLFVNCSSTPASYLTPLIMAIEKLRELFSAKIEKIECTIPNLVLEIINKLEKENIEYRKTNIQYQIYIDTLKNQRLENKELMKKSIKDQYNKSGDTRQVITRLEKLTLLPK